MENRRDFVIENSVLTKYTGPGGDVTIPEGVTEIGESAFEYCKSLTSVTIPEGVTEIGDWAFYDCTGVKILTILSAMEHVRADTFGNEFTGFYCPVLIAPHIPISGFDPALKPRACCGFAKLYLENAELDGELKAGYLKYIRSQRKRLFPLVMENQELLQVMLREKMLNRKDIDLLLPECGKQKDIAAKAAVMDYAGKNLEPVDPAKEMEREFAAMERSAKNQEEFQTTGVMKAGEAKKIFCYKKLEEGGLAITGYKGTDTDMVIPKAIGKDPVVEISKRAFKDCTSLTSVTIPDSVAEIGEDAFSGCTGLADKLGMVVLYGILFSYTGPGGDVVIPEGVTTIYRRPFFGKELTSVTIPESVTEIGEHAFSLCKSLTHVTIPEGVRSIGEYAFDGCENLKSIAIPAGVTEISKNAFSRCKGLTRVTIPEGVTEVGDWAFDGCENLKSIAIPESVAKIGGDAFYRCKKLKSIAIPAGVTEIEGRTFLGCTGLTSVTIPEGVTKIGGWAFHKCMRLTNVTIPKSVTKIELGVFSHCTRLTSVAIPENVTEIGDRAFQDCTGLTSVTIPEGVTKIGWGAFKGCSNLTIHAPAGSAAEQCAKENGIPFEAI